MRWRRSPGDSSGIEDRRRSGGGGMIPGGKIGGGIGGAGIVGVIVALLVVFLGGGGGGGFEIGPSLDPFQPAAPAAQDVVEGGPDPEADLRDFVAFVVSDVQNSWDEQFRTAGRQYDTTTLVLFRGNVSTAGCGAASSAAGPFYCPADRRVYLDLGFFRELQQRFGAPGDFAQAYVIAHEFGHHVQNLLGIMGQVDAERRRNPGAANDLSVRLELQADCLAGVWAHSAYQDDLLEEGDLEEGLNAAASVGDDRIQSQAGGRIDPESFTHGTAEQRREWFQRGFDGGEVAACDTFS